MEEAIMVLSQWELILRLLLGGRRLDHPAQ